MFSGIGISTNYCNLMLFPCTFSPPAQMYFDLVFMICILSSSKPPDLIRTDYWVQPTSSANTFFRALFVWNLRTIQVDY